MRAVSLIALALGLVVTPACSDSSDDHSVHDAGSSTSQSDAASTSGGDSGTTVTLKAPTIEMVMAMSGGLHVTWKNNQTDCDAIEGERKSATEAYKVVFTIPDGSVDNKHDAPLKAGVKYTYRLRCKKGADYSDYSNEKSGTP